MPHTAVVICRKGFTLIELLSVIVIIGILAAIAVPNYTSYMARSREKAAETAIAEARSRLSLAYARYLLENGDKPATMNVFLNTTVSSSIGLSGNTLDLGSDFTVTLTHNSTAAAITVSEVKGVTLDTSQTGTWTLPDS
ncbi:MAG: prepilin-type N-terminal cleavage/methylation domain-containing protein [Desulfotignum sp.]|nr:prepilin-type N-terminal cleavage/methylation domain-containing protein [Desulfotignum sp.]